MTAKDRAAVKRAIDLIHREDDYDGGMAILCRLAGIQNDPIETVPCSPADLAAIFEKPKRKRR